MRPGSVLLELTHGAELGRLLIRLSGAHRVVQPQSLPGHRSGHHQSLQHTNILALHVGLYDLLGGDELADPFPELAADVVAAEGGEGDA